MRDQGRTAGPTQRPRTHRTRAGIPVSAVRHHLFILEDLKRGAHLAHLGLSSSRSVGPSRSETFSSQACGPDSAGPFRFRHNRGVRKGKHMEDGNDGALSDEIIRVSCRSCARGTRHRVLYELKDRVRSDIFHDVYTWQVVRCLGCDTMGFRHQHDDFDSVKELADGSTTHSTTSKRYPLALNGRQALGIPFFSAPRLIRQVYQQTISAYAGDSPILAGIGLRATIEAVCNEQKISGNSLEKRIDQLYKTGLISNGDKRRLHAIRFLGNDAAHEIREPKEDELRVALDIVDHLINSVYILEYRAKKMDLPVETFEEFITLLESCAKASESEQPQSLASILGRHKRRVGAELPSFDTTLAKAINLGTIKFLEFSSEEMVEGKPVQLYRIVKDEFADDIPF